MRIRDFGLSPGSLPTGQHNAITDVDGVLVGHTTLIRGDDVRTGVTAILPHGGNLFEAKVPAAVQRINGFGKPTGFEQIRELGSIETPILLTNTLNVPRVADALVTYMLAQNPRIGLDSAGTVNPVVGECNDGFLNDIRARHVIEQDVLNAIANASAGPVAEGCVGAGTGTICYRFKGGIGTASRQAAGYTVGALLQTNFGRRELLTVGGVPVGRLLADVAQPQVGPGSVMIVLATDAPLTVQQLERLTQRAAFGLGRTGSSCQDGSGDFVIAFSTANQRGHGVDLVSDIQRVDSSRILDELFLAVVECVEEAVYNSLTAATTMQGRGGNTVYALPHDRLRDLLAG